MEKCDGCGREMTPGWGKPIDGKGLYCNRCQGVVRVSLSSDPKVRRYYANAAKEILAKPVRNG